jgi:soluble lytic murein transglycosylase-like protein
MQFLMWTSVFGTVIYMLLLLVQPTGFPHWEILKRNQTYSAHSLESMAHMAALLNDLDPEIFIAQMRQESQFNQFARSQAGAVGVAQIMPATAKGWKIDPHDPLASLDAAARNMARYIKTYKAQGHDQTTAYKLALAAYNAGPGAVQKYKGVPPYPETQRYVNVILASK